VRASLAQNFQEHSPAEIILGLEDKDVLRLYYTTHSDNGQFQSVELFVWICPRTSFFTGLYVIDKSVIKMMSERQLNSQQLLLLINNTSFRPGLDIIEISDIADIADLQRLHKLIENMI
jgi:hypothetical protein